MFGFMADMGNYEARRVARWDDETGEKMVSTAAVSDGRLPYETAFMHPEYNDGSMVIVEAYDTKEAAQEGHNRWLKIMQEGPLPPLLMDCANSEVGQFLDALGGNLTFPRKTLTLIPKEEKTV